MKRWLQNFSKISIYKASVTKGLVKKMENLPMVDDESDDVEAVCLGVDGSLVVGDRMIS